MSVDLAQVGQSIGPRFQLISAIPGATLVGSLWLMFATGAASNQPSFATVADNLRDFGVPQAALFLSLAVFIGLLTHPFHTALVQILEGYWPPRGLLALAAERSRFRHLARKKTSNRIALGLESPVRSFGSLERFMLNTSATRVRQRIRATRIHEGYPRDNHVMPTRLGNALRLAEDLAGPRYGLATSDVLPFLYFTAPADFVMAIEDAKASLDVAVKLVYVWLFVTPVALWLFANDGLWLLVPLLAFSLAWGAYRGAVIEAGAYGRMMIRGFALYRSTLYKAVSLEPPLPDSDERPTAQMLARRLGVQQPSEAANAIP